MAHRGLAIGLLALASCTDASPPSEPGADAVTTILFADSFTRTIAPDGGLGPDWAIARGLWFVGGRAETDSNSGNQAAAIRATCADCCELRIVDVLIIQREGIHDRTCVSARRARDAETRTAPRRRQ